VKAGQTMRERMTSVVAHEQKKQQEETHLAVGRTADFTIVTITVTVLAILVLASHL
jgi:hypothetical protein